MSNVTASILANAIPARLSHFDGRDRLTFDVPEGWDDVKKVCRKVLTCGGKNFVFIGWNSDRNECFFIEDKGSVAMIKKP